MDLGTSRFLEMFEERFGSRATTIVLAIIGLALALLGIGEIVDKTIYFYGLIRSANFIAALKQESAATHLIIFTVQIVVTFLVLVWVWRQFYRRKMTVWAVRLEKTHGQIRTAKDELEARFNDVMKKHADFMQYFVLHKETAGQLEKSMATVLEGVQKAVKTAQDLKDPIQKND